MTSEELRAALLQAIASVAPEADLGKLKGDVELRPELDLDSMDFLQVVTRLGEALHLDIPESDYAQLATLDGCVAYLAARVPQPP